LKILDKLKKALTPELNLYSEPRMEPFGKLDEYPKATKKELERMERRIICKK